MPPTSKTNITNREREGGRERQTEDKGSGKDREREKTG